MEYCLSLSQILIRLTPHTIKTIGQLLMSQDTYGIFQKPQ